MIIKPYIRIKRFEMGIEFGEKLESTLKEQGMTQKELAEKANITESAVSHYVKGDREPRGATIGVIAGVLGVTAGFLLGASVASPSSDKAQQTFDELKASVKKNKSSLSESQRFELIRLLSN